jgi:hypothetical protein
MTSVDWMGAFWYEDTAMMSCGDSPPIQDYRNSVLSVSLFLVLLLRVFVVIKCIVCLGDDKTLRFFNIHLKKMMQAVVSMSFDPSAPIIFVNLYILSV